MAHDADAHHAHHEHLVQELASELEPVFSHSPQGIYLYLDDTHKACNKRFAQMLGYSSPKEWVTNEYPISDVAQKDQQKGIKAYMDASQKFKATTLSVTWVKKEGKKIKTNVLLTPISYKGEVFVLHFVEPVN